MPEPSKAVTLSLRLLREGRTVETALTSEHDLDEVPCEAARLFIGAVPPHPPDWRRFVEELVPQASRPALEPLLNQHASAVLFLDIPHPTQRRHSRLMAVTFGQGHHALDSSSYERNFGLRVTLNSVARNRLRTVDTATLDVTTFLRRVQSSRDADLQGFDIDVDRDLIRLAAGHATDVNFARSLAGRDSLSLTAKLTPRQLIDKCTTVLNRYFAEDYKKDFGFLDNITPIRDPETIAKLDAELFAELKKLIAGAASDLHLSFPEIMGPEEGIDIAYFGFGRPGRKPSHADLSIEDYVAALREANFSGTMEDVKSGHEIRVVQDGAGDKGHRRKVYDCVVLEVEIDNNIYVLFGGDWYKVDKRYRDEVDGYFKSLIATPIVASTRAANEREFIDELGAPANHLILDQIKITPIGTARANIEPCDILSKSSQFIHLKDGHGSAPISHLWSQAVVSGELFVGDESFRKQLRTEIRKRERKYSKAGFVSLVPEARIPRPAERGDTIVYGILRRPTGSGKIDLPFFSKISLRPAAQRLKMLGYKVEVHLIAKTAPATSLSE